VNFWNSLPEYEVTADSVNSFKGRLTNVVHICDSAPMSMISDLT